MSFFDVDYLSNKTNKYETNHFHIILNDESHIQINTEGKIDTSLVTTKEYGIILHEYIHYTQHLLTLFGIKRCQMFNSIFREYIYYMLQNENIKLPIKVTDVNKKIENYYVYLKNIQGTQHYSKYNIDAVEVSDQDIEIARTNKCSVKIGIYDFENNEAKDKEIEFGYWCIIESMAHLIQKLIDSDVDNRHNIMPYRIVELVCKSKYPTTIFDDRMMISLCQCSLMFDNPGAAFFEIADYVIKNQIKDGIELYSHVMNDFQICYKEKKLPLYKVISLFIDELVESIESVIGTKVNYLKKIAKSCKEEAECKQCILINILYDENIKLEETAISILSEFYGYPLIQAKNTVIIPNKTSNNTIPYVETARLLGLELLYKRLTSQKTECSFYEICRKNQYLSEEERTSASVDVTSKECLYDQWNKKEECLMTKTFEFYHLKNKHFNDTLNK